MKMNKIFGIGLSRTGTTSLSHTLKEIGINIIHYPNKSKLFDPNNDGACDIPAAVHYKKLDKIFPNSKFIYTIRDKDEWLSSIGGYLEYKKERKMTPWELQNRKELYGQLNFDKDVFATKYDEHDNSVREYFKGREQDLLILNICGGDKLEKLLSFVGSSNALPNKLFSHINTKEQQNK